MKKPKITQGEWQVNPEHPNIVHCKGGRIANTLFAPELPIGHPFNEDAEANARLIGAAPAMMDTLISAQKFIENGVELGYIQMPDSLDDPAIKTPIKIKQALKKAGCV